MPAKTWFSIRASASPCAASGSAEVEIDIFDHIGKFGISAEMFITALRPLRDKNVTFNINCPGGSCNEGLSIYDAISEFTGHVTMNVLGVAASMASVIILAAKNRTISANGRIMIHRVTAGIEGNPDQLQAGTDVARQFEDRIVRIYRDNLKLTEAEIRDKMKTEIGSWFFGEEAVAAGFATSINPAAKPRAFKSEWASLFTMLPAALFDTSSIAMETPHALTPPAASAAPVEPPAPAAAPDPAPVEPPAAPPAPETPPAPESPPVEPPAPAAAGFIERAVAALTGSRTLNAANTDLTARLELAETQLAAMTQRATTAENRIAEIEAAVTAAETRATAAEATVRTVGQSAAEIAASHGLRPDAQGNLPAPAGEAGADKTITKAEFDKLDHPARNQFFRDGGHLID